MPQGLEVVTPSDPEWAATATEVSSKPGEKLEAAGGQTGVTQQAWWKRKIFLIGVVIVIVVAIALGVGLGVGLTTNKFVHPNVLHEPSHQDGY
jgi:hypothetical protein